MKKESNVMTAKPGTHSRLTAANCVDRRTAVISRRLPNVSRVQAEQPCRATPKEGSRQFLDSRPRVHPKAGASDQALTISKLPRLGPAGSSDLVSDSF